MRRNLSLCASIVGAVAPALLTMHAPAFAGDEVFTATTAITLPNNQRIRSFDISYVDPVLGTYFLADRTNNAVDVIDTHTNTVSQIAVGQFVGFTGNNDTSGPNGLLTIHHRELWVGDGGSLVKVIDLATNTITHTINTGGVNRADELCHDPVNHLVLMANDAESPAPFVTLISTETYSVVKKIVFDGTNNTVKATNGIEQCQWNPRTGKFYLNIPEINGN